jgi:GTP cyclohydrolase II
MINPTSLEILARARADFRMGLPVFIDGVLAAPAETISEARLAAMRALGPVHMAITARRAQTLKARIYDNDLARIALPDWARLDWVQAVADPIADMANPMKGPFQELREGAAQAERMAIGLAKSARLLPAVLMVKCAAPLNLTSLPDDAEHLLSTSSVLSDIVHARLPISVSQNARLHVFRPEDGAEEHYAVEIGRPERPGPVLARLHSACFTGDVLGSLKCDCGPQLHGALAQMGEEGAGVLLYLNQEGRGIGLANKMRAYALQDQGFDTVEANHRLGFEDDERDFRLGTAILRKLGFGAVRLLTNNPAKVAMMQAQGITVAERVPLQVGRNPFNQGYLDTKARKSGHFL